MISGEDSHHEKIPAPPQSEAARQPPIPSAQQAASALCAIIPIVQGAWAAIGAATVLSVLAGSWGPGQGGLGVRFLTLIGGVAQILFYLLLAVSSGPLLRACATALVLRARHTRAAERLEERLLPAIEQVAGALERTPMPAQAPAARARTDPYAEIRAAIRGLEWARADELIRGFIDANPGDPEGARLARERDDALAGDVQALRARIDAAREVNDPQRALELRDAMVPLLEAGALRSLDQELVRWLMGLIQKRLRAGTMRVDVAELAALVAERFDYTVEGASLRASLPTLRRSAGLCARCGQPYTGIADACPTCLSTASFPAFGATPDADPDELDQPGDWSSGLEE